MSLLTSDLSRVYGAGIRRGALGALVAVQNLVIAGSSGHVQHAARFFLLLYPILFTFRRWHEWAGVHMNMELWMEISLLIQGLMFMFQRCSNKVSVYFTTSCMHAIKKNLLSSGPSYFWMLVNCLTVTVSEMAHQASPRGTLLQNFSLYFLWPGWKDNILNVISMGSGCKLAFHHNTNKHSTCL